MSQSAVGTVPTVDMWGSSSSRPDIITARPPQLQGQHDDDAAEHQAVIGRLRPLNNRAKIAMRRLADLRGDPSYAHHQQFLHPYSDAPDPDIDDQDQDQGQSPERDQQQRAENFEFVFALGTLPEFAPLGWRLGKGRPASRNHAVDILLLADPDDNVAGVHCRFAWSKGGGGFFVIADNLRGARVNLNGESLRRDQRLVPFRNTIQVGECFFTIVFEKRTKAQEELFQGELLNYYRIVLGESAPLILPTPSGNETRFGNWMLRNPLGKGSFGSVSIVTHAHTGESAAMKEIWGTAVNRRAVDREIKIARTLLKVRHVGDDGTHV